MVEERRQESAIEHAEELLETLEVMHSPIDLFQITASEEPLLILKNGDYRNRFDGQLEYHRKQRRFVLFFNTKYDDSITGSHHPRTRFSLAHELGHYFLDRHREYLLRGGRVHGSSGEFSSLIGIEREADAFAAGLLMPRKLMVRQVNSAELTLARIDELAKLFGTSRVSTAIRCVQLSHFPCALIGIRDGSVAWTFRSSCFKDKGCYPRDRAAELPLVARTQWLKMAKGDYGQFRQDVELGQWFQTYDWEDLDQIYLTAAFFPAPSMSPLIVLVTGDEDDFAPLEED